MHEWEKQEKLLDKIEKVKLENCLTYNHFAYEKHEWDNIPAIVPRYIIYLAKYMDGICAFCTDVDSREHTRDLRQSIEHRLSLTDEHINKNRSDDLFEKGNISVQIKNIEQNAQQFREDYEFFKHQATKFSDSECAFTFNESMQVVLKTRGEFDAYDGDNQQFEIERQQKRMYSFKQLFSLVNMIANQSTVNDRLIQAENDVKKLYSEVEQLKKDDNSLKAYFDEQMANFKAKNDSDLEEQAAKNDDFNSRIDDNKTNLGQHRDLLGKINGEMKQMKSFSDNLNSNIQKCFQKIDYLKTDTHSNISTVKEDFKERLGELDKIYSELMEEMSGNIEQVRIIARDQVNTKEKELQELMDRQVTKIQKFVDENIDDMINERKATLSKYEKQFSQIKLVCCKYFERYDIELEAVKIKAKAVMEKYQDWSKVLIEPTSLNDARLFALESRLHEEEEIRIKEFEFISEALKKLIYTLEQTSMAPNEKIVNVEQTSPTKDVTPILLGKSSTNQISLANKSQTPLLPNLLNNQSLQNSVRDNNMIQMNKLGHSLYDSFISEMGPSKGSIKNPSSVELMLLKRLNYLRNQLENHNARETTQHMRDLADRKKEERLAELWKTELDKPSVMDLVQKMRRQAEQDGQASSRFNAILNSIQGGGLGSSDYKYIQNLGDSLDSITLPGNSNQVEQTQYSQYFPQAQIIAGGSGTITYGDKTPMQQTGINEKNYSTGGDKQRFGSKPREYAEMSIQQNLNKSKFITQGDHEFMESQSKVARLQPIKQRIQEAEQDKFWQDFNPAVHMIPVQQQKSQKLLKDRFSQNVAEGQDLSSMQGTRVSFKDTSGQDKNTQNKDMGVVSGASNYDANKGIKLKAFGQDRNSTVIPRQGLKENLIN